MKNLSISTAWNEAAAFVKREGSLLFPVAFALVALPSILFQATAPVPVPGETPDPGFWPLFLLPMLLVTLLGTLTLTIMALHPGTVVRDAIVAAARRVIPVFGAVFLFALVVSIFAVPIAVAGALGNKAMSALVLLIAIPLVAFVSVRLLLVNPVGANESAGPIAILKRSWALTSGHFWKLLGFLIIVAVVAIVVMLAVSTVGGVFIVLVAGKPDPGSLPAVLLLVIGGLLNAIVSVYVTAAVARIYAQLA